ncbi:MAG: (d)CMP kinase [Bacilli bacterium]|nr:(d)CMP kinase [Bacilli bacterium]
MKIIAIDGPSGSGKGTIAKEVAKRLNYTYIDTGAMYRCVSLMSLRENLKETDEKEIVDLLKKADIRLTNEGKVFLNSEDVSDKIRTMEVTHRVSKISSIIALREVMREKQREFATKNSIVMEGRDITTEVFPDADYKFYLDASVEERARRRQLQNEEKGIESTYEEVKAAIEERDYDDMHRPVGALTRTDDQIYIDSSNMEIEEVINFILEKVGE